LTSAERSGREGEIGRETGRERGREREHARRHDLVDVVGAVEVGV
jgi:hypothetical protein